MVNKIVDSLPDISAVGGSAPKAGNLSDGQDFSAFLQEATRNSCLLYTSDAADE